LNLTPCAGTPRQSQPDGIAPATVSDIPSQTSLSIKQREPTRWSLLLFVLNRIDNGANDSSPACCPRLRSLVETGKASSFPPDRPDFVRAFALDRRAVPDAASTPFDRFRTCARKCPSEVSAVARSFHRLVSARAVDSDVVPNTASASVDHARTCARTHPPEASASPSSSSPRLRSRGR